MEPVWGLADMPMPWRPAHSLAFAMAMRIAFPFVHTFLEQSVGDLYRLLEHWIGKMLHRSGMAIEVPRL